MQNKVVEVPGQLRRAGYCLSLGGSPLLFSIFLDLQKPLVPFVYPWPQLLQLGQVPLDYLAGLLQGWLVGGVFDFRVLLELLQDERGMAEEEEVRLLVVAFAFIDAGLQRSVSNAKQRRRTTDLFLDGVGAAQPIAERDHLVVVEAASLLNNVLDTQRLGDPEGGHVDGGVTCSRAPAWWVRTSSGKRGAWMAGETQQTSW